MKKLLLVVVLLAGCTEKAGPNEMSRGDACTLTCLDKPKFATASQDDVILCNTKECCEERCYKDPRAKERIPKKYR